jgi:histidine ammonia-lyase
MDYNYLPLDSTPVNLNQLRMLLQYKQHISITFQAWEAVEKCRHYLDEKLAVDPGALDGLFSSIIHLPDDIEALEETSGEQFNLLQSHAKGWGEEVTSTRPSARVAQLQSRAKGWGEEVPPEITKLMIMLKVKSLSYGQSGVQNPTIQRLMDMHNNDVIPVVYMQNAQDDLSALSHLCLPIIGLGEVWYKGEKRKTKEVETELGWKRVHLKNPEEIALITGTQYMLSHGIWGLLKAMHLMDVADLLAELSPDPLLFTSRVHGAIRDTLKHVADVLLNEVNTPCEAPYISKDENIILKSENYNSQPIALVLGILKLALDALATISEQRARHIASKSNQDFYLAPKEMIGNDAAAQCLQALNNLIGALAVELLISIKALETRRPLKSSEAIEKLRDDFKGQVDITNGKGTLYDHILETMAFIDRLKI